MQCSGEYMLPTINSGRCCHVSAGSCPVKAVDYKSGQWDYECKMWDKRVMDKIRT